MLALPSPLQIQPEDDRAVRELKGQFNALLLALRNHEVDRQSERRREERERQQNRANAEAARFLAEAMQAGGDVVGDVAFIEPNPHGHSMNHGHSATAEESEGGHKHSVLADSHVHSMNNHTHAIDLVVEDGCGNPTGYYVRGNTLAPDPENTGDANDNFYTEDATATISVNVVDHEGDTGGTDLSARA